MKLENAIEFIVNIKNEVRKFANLRLTLNRPSTIKVYIESGFLMILNQENFSVEEKMKFKELQIRHIDLFSFIELIQTGKIADVYDNLEELFQNIIDFCPEGKEIRRKKRVAYQFLQENKIQDTTSNSYFTRSPYTDNILKGIDIPEHQLVQILIDYQKYVNNTEWRNYILEKEKEALKRKNMKKTFTQWLQA
jgi:hypothetical protein